MPRDLSDVIKNYERFPGDEVEVAGNVVRVGNKIFHLVYNYREAFDGEKLGQRFSEILAKYDYIVGDWGHEQLRLKGFYSMSRKKMPSQQKIDYLADYVQEYMNYGAAFFVLKRMRSKDIKKEEAYVAERVTPARVAKPKLPQQKRHSSKLEAPGKNPAKTNRPTRQKQFTVRKRSSEL